MRFLFILLGPPAVGLLAVFLFDWAFAGRTTTTGATSDRQATAQSAPPYRPTGIAYDTIFWTLIAFSVLGGPIDERAIRWIEIFHDQLQGQRIERQSIIEMAQLFQNSGGQKIRGLLIRDKDSLSLRDKEFIIKSCCLMAVWGGRILAAKERDMIFQICEVFDISEKRLYELVDFELINPPR